MARVSTTCPFCGSDRITQTNEETNKFIAEAATAAIDYFLGTHGYSKAISDELTHKYRCLSCGREWKGDEAKALGIEDDQLAFDHAVKEICQNNELFHSLDGVMKFCIKMDAYCYNCNNLSNVTKYEENDIFYPSDEYISKYSFLKAFACLDYVAYRCANDPDVYKSIDLHMACQSGMEFCRQSYEVFQYSETELCYNILNYIDSMCFYETPKSEINELKHRCIMPDDISSFTFNEDTWKSYLDWVLDITNE